MVYIVLYQEKKKKKGSGPLCKVNFIVSSSMGTLET